jgi:hypothetical protein
MSGNYSCYRDTRRSIDRLQKQTLSLRGISTDTIDSMRSRLLETQYAECLPLIVFLITETPAILLLDHWVVHRCFGAFVLPDEGKCEQPSGVSSPQGSFLVLVALGIEHV